MITEAQALKTLDGINVYDGMIFIQAIEKLLQRGLVTGKELGHIASVRTKVKSAIDAVVGFDIDSPEAAPEGR